MDFRKAHTAHESLNINRFNKVKQRLTDYGLDVMSAEYLASGHFGMVLNNLNGTVTKLLYRGDDLSLYEQNSTALRNEIAGLRALHGKDLGGIAVPELVSQPVMDMSDPEIMAAYTMTKVPGAPLGNRLFFSQTATPEADFLARLEQVGSLVATFHNVTAQFSDSQKASFFADYDWAAEITPDPILNDKQNKAVEILNDYLQATKKPAIGHFDLHGNNVLADADSGKITGIIDFGNMGQSSNHAVEFVNIVSDALPHVIGAYNQISETPVDVDVINITRLIGQFMYAKSRIETENIPPSDALVQVEERLRELSHLTGYHQK